MRLIRISYDFPLKLHMTQYYALKISVPASWYSNVYGGTIREGGLPMWGFQKGDRNVLQHFMNCAARSWIVILLQVKTILSMMGIIIALLIRTRSYSYWMRLSRISYDFPLKLHMTQYYSLKISGPGSWYSNVNGDTYHV